MQYITTIANNCIRECCSECFPELRDQFNDYVVTKSVNYDYQFNKIAHLVQITKIDLDNIIEMLFNKLQYKDLIESVEIIKNKKNIFIAFNINKILISKKINELYSSINSTGKIHAPIISDLPNEVVIDFSSPNIAKEMHIGHLRSTIIGESLCRLYEFCGSKVHRVNHIGDWGTQFGMLIAYIRKFNIISRDLSSILEIYRLARKLFESDPEFQKDSLMETVRLQNGFEDNLAIWKEIREISLTSFNNIYHELGTHAEIIGESFYQSRMIDLINNLENNIKNENGMKVIFIDNFEIPLILVKSDGGFTYDTSDLAAIKYRFVEQKIDRVIYVVDSGQSQHFQMIFKLASQLSWCKNEQCYHIGFGVILGNNGKRLKTRSGETVLLRDVLQQVQDRAILVTKSLRQNDTSDYDISQISRTIANNCIKYSDLNNPRENNYRFDVDKMTNTKGNTAVYLMYTLARCHGILRKISNLSIILDGDIEINDADTRYLAILLLKYVEFIEKSIKEHAPHYICNYLYELSVQITKFYSNNRCLEIENGEIIHVYHNRIRLIHLATIIIHKMFELIGLEYVEQI
ncbi:arginyl-tRNA synthetase [Megavirus baoshan]|uniref:arginine--tRNA ligase n=1 Tax=Megavirus baoshan TaxID=2496520 RepID=A0A3S8UYV7_9VIRU|nr:arginyl-tRNA synthetase [Megavirus baoshan]AZL89903.1 arginyl-tRNA synthetase [Megavirus baoshan]